MAVVLTLFIVGCSQKPAKIHYQSDECAHCKMMITDERFAAQLVTNKGKAIKFDAIECMAAYSNNHKEVSGSSKLWVSNFNNPGEWLGADEAVIIKSEVIKSPMGESLLTLPSEAEADRHVKKYPGEKMSWYDVINL